MKLNSVTSLTKTLLLSIIRLYQALQFMRQPACRFYPSCSQFMYTAITKHGVFKGLMLGCLRLLKCQPLNPGGVDEVPADVNCVARSYFTSLWTTLAMPTGRLSTLHRGSVPGSPKRLRG